MNDQKFEIDNANDFFEDDGFEKYEVSEVIQQRTNSAKNFALAVQWHPELMFKTDKNAMALFEALVEAAKN